MSDILKFVTHTNALRDDPNGNLFGLNAWSEDSAVEIAESMGLTMDPQRWAVVHFLRDCYRDFGDEVSAREASNLLAEKFALRGGPVSQGYKIAGLPTPPHHDDPSFGHRH